MAQLRGARLKIGVLISGRGSNLQALIDSCARPDYPAEIALVVANRADAFGIERARLAGLPAMVIPHRDFADRASFDAALDQALRQAGVELVCNAGFMRILTSWFVERWRDRQINIHPSLLPAFPGLHTHERALVAGVRFSGCTVHFVRTAMDTGPIIAQAAVPVLQDDDADCLAARVLAAEHRLFPLALRLVAEGRTRIVADADGSERVVIADAGAPSDAILNPLE
ncbi:MAG TPA: phosphoribosylglycinamide formyltransferase [Stellaceae bacterium]|nr:phosphoribosylglycinamide formyltransferase [Stellaceae bacterium]